jgi:hypothetical protein
VSCKNQLFQVCFSSAYVKLRKGYNLKEKKAKNIHISEDDMVILRKRRDLMRSRLHITRYINFGAIWEL